MARFKVLEDGKGLQVRIEELGGEQPAVLKALQECAEGRCTCPTPQYERLQSVEIVPGEDEIRVSLTPRAGETIDRQAIDKCLEYTASEVAGKK